MDFGRCDRCRHYAPVAANVSWKKCPAGICHLKWRSLGPRDEVPLVNHDSHCGGFEMKVIEPTRRQIEAAALVMNEHGLAISLPWQGDLDDIEKERYEALRLALAAALAVGQS